MASFGTRSASARRSADAFVMSISAPRRMTNTPSSSRISGSTAVMSGTYPLPDHPLDFAAVCAALRSLHYHADDCPNRLFITRFDARYRTRFLADRLSHYGTQLALPPAAQPLLGHNRLRVASALDQHVEHLLGGRLRDLLGADHRDKPRQRVGLDRGVGGIRIADPGRKLVRDPVGQRTGVTVP